MTDSVMDLEFNLHRGLKVGGFFLKVLVFRIVESLTCQTVRNKNSSSSNMSINVGAPRGCKMKSTS